MLGNKINRIKLINYESEKLFYFLVNISFFLYFSLQYLNYPTQVIFKSCKLIPVLIGGILIQRKQKGLLDFVAAIVMCIGLAIFLLADSQVSLTQ